MGKVIHDSDCALHNAPALPVGPCDCKRAPMSATLKTYAGSDVGVSQCLVTLEGFLADMDHAELADDSTIDIGDAVIAVTGLVWSLERREGTIEHLRTALTKLSNEVLASLPLMEPLARREFGNTNYSILIQRAEEARAVLNAQ